MFFAHFREVADAPGALLRLGPGELLSVRGFRTTVGCNHLATRPFGKKNVHEKSVH
jgi:hypothetical protein